MPIRYQVSRLLDHGYRGEVEHLILDLKHLEKFKNLNPPAWERITDYQKNGIRSFTCLKR